MDSSRYYDGSGDSGGERSNKQDVVDVASMSAGRSADPASRLKPRADRDGFDLISSSPIRWDADLTSEMGFVDVAYLKSSDDRAACVRINRPEVLNAFRPRTVREMQRALEDATDDPDVGVVVFDGAVRPGEFAPAFCAGGDQAVRSDGGGGYYDETESQPKLRVLDLQIQIRRCPKPVVAVVRGYAVGGGHILHMVCDLTLATTEAVFGQTGPRMGSFDAGYGCAQAAHLMGQKRARELWFLSRFYSADEALRMGLVNAVFEPSRIDGELGRWIRRMMMNSPTAIAATKASCNAVQDGAAGLSQMGGELTRLFYLSEEASEGRKAFLEKRAPNFRSRL